MRLRVTSSIHCESGKVYYRVMQWRTERAPTWPNGYDKPYVYAYVEDWYPVGDAYEDRQKALDHAFTLATFKPEVLWESPAA